MDDYDLRTTCLDLALKTGGTIGASEVLASARQYYNFVTGIEVKQKIEGKPHTRKKKPK